MHNSTALNLVKHESVFLTKGSLTKPFLLPAAGDSRGQHLIHFPHGGDAHCDGSSGRGKHHPARHQDCRSQRSAVPPC